MDLQKLAAELDKFCAANVYIGPPPWATQQPAPEPELVTVKQAAKMFALGERTVYRLVQDGLIPSSKVGRAVRLKPADLRRYLEETRLD
jgi:excisionase family DNA binding protein